MYSEEISNNIRKDFCRLEVSGITYLDHSGATLYSDNQIKAVANDMLSNIYGNPHSLSICSKYTTDVVDQVRYRILNHFNTNSNEYSVIFTSGATAALKLVAENFNWNGSSNSSGTFAYLQDNHTSVLGMRELAVGHGANIRCITLEEAFNTLSNSNQEQMCNSFKKCNSLFIFPAQSNFCGTRYPLSWIQNVQNGSLDAGQSNWYCCLDAAAFLTTSTLDLTSFQPDFVCLSFYKIFGYPTGLGALLVKNSRSQILLKEYFGGGTVFISLSTERFHVLRTDISERFEDGTIPFLSVVAVKHGFDTIDKLIPGGVGGGLVGSHTLYLAKFVHDQLIQLHHANGEPAARLYSHTDYKCLSSQGAIVNFNLLRSNGEVVGFMEVLNMANLNGIQLRTGCFCNPGACQLHLGLSKDDLLQHFEAGHVCGDEKDIINGKPTGSIRISFGYMSQKEDADKFIKMITSVFVQHPAVIKYQDEHSMSSKNFFKSQLESDIFKSQKLHILKNTSISFTAHPDLSNSRLAVPFSNKLSKSIDTKISLETFSSLLKIFIYPIKSCGAFGVSSWFIGQRGLLYDREWMIVDTSGVCLTQKQEPYLCMLQPTICLDEEKLHLNYPGMEPLSISFQINEINPSQYSMCQSKVCKDKVNALDCGDEVSSWLSQALNRPGLRLLRQLSNDSRKGRSMKMKNKGDGNDEDVFLSLANQAQFLMLNEASIKWFANVLEESAGWSSPGLLDRFRCNFLIAETEPFVENSWNHLMLGDIKFKVDGPCTRCQMICIDQTTGEKTKEPLRTLAETFHGKIRFGIYLRLADKILEPVNIAVGDSVVVIS